MNAQNIGQILDAIAARFSVPAAHLWAILVRQAYVEAFTSFVGFLVVSVVTALLWRKGVRVHAEDSYAAEPWFVGAMCVSLVCAIFFIMLVIDVSHALNPEYYALMKVLDAIGAATK